MHRQQLELLLTDDLLLQGHWEKKTLLAQRASFNTLDNWGHKTPAQSKKRKDRKEKIKRSWPKTCIQYTQLQLQKRLKSINICIFTIKW